MKYISNLIFILFFISSIFSQNILSFEYTGGDSLKIKLSNTDEVGGFQFLIDGINFLSASGGVAESNGFSTTTSGSTVLGFSFTGSTIPAGENHLTTLIFDSLAVNQNTICFNPEITDCPGIGTGACCKLSAPNTGEELEITLGECISGCFDNSACNSLTVADCIYAMTYYQDIDNDLMGNELISQMYCYDEIPEVGWVLGPDNGGNSFDIDGGEECPEDSPLDCSGVCGGEAIVDECDICGGNGLEENYDCDGNCTSNLDECGECGGTGPEENYNCDGECTQFLDMNGVCCDFSDADCSGVCGGENIIPEGECDCVGTLPEENFDCDGNCTVGLDNCGECGGSGVDIDGDDICDDVDDCIEENGASQECGCNTTLNTDGCCGDVMDIDGDDICDDVDDCIEENGASQECGCNTGIAEGNCDCAGNPPVENYNCAGDLLNNSIYISDEFSINNIYPNPFNPIVSITYGVPTSQYVEGYIYNLSGDRISTLVSHYHSLGNYSLEWNATGNPSGIYIFILKTNSNVKSRKLVLLK